MKRFLVLISFCLAQLADGQPVQIVVPNNLANVEGNTNVTDFLNSPTFRMQMVFDASQFALPSGPNISNAVTSIWFRLDGASTNDVLTVFGGASVTLSTTLKTPDNLSPVFADNVGADAVTIYSGAGAFGGGYFPGTIPQPFVQDFIALTPFYYFPSQGNLLVEIAAAGRQPLFPGALDAQLVNSDSVSRVFAASDLATSGTPDSLALVTRFNFTVVPEPSSWILVGLVAATVFRQRK